MGRVLSWNLPQHYASILSSFSLNVSTFSLFPAIRMVLGYILGHVLVLLLRPPSYIRVHVVALSTFGTIGNLPLVLVAALAVDGPHLFGPNAEVLGTVYVAFGMFVFIFVLFSLGYEMMKRQAEMGVIVYFGDEQKQSPSSKLKKEDILPSHNCLESDISSTMGNAEDTHHELGRDDVSIIVNQPCESCVHQSYDQYPKVFNGRRGDKSWQDARSSRSKQQPGEPFAHQLSQMRTLPVENDDSSNERASGKRDDKIEPNLSLNNWETNLTACQPGVVPEITLHASHIQADQQLDLEAATGNSKSEIMKHCNSIQQTNADEQINVGMYDSQADQLQIGKCAQGSNETRTSCLCQGTSNSVWIEDELIQTPTQDGMVQDVDSMAWVDQGGKIRARLDQCSNNQTHMSDQRGTGPIPEKCTLQAGQEANSSVNIPKRYDSSQKNAAEDPPPRAHRSGKRTQHGQNSVSTSNRIMLTSPSGAGLSLMHAKSIAQRMEEKSLDFLDNEEVTTQPMQVHVHHQVGCQTDSQVQNEPLIGKWRCMLWIIQAYNSCIDQMTKLDETLTDFRAYRLIKVLTTPPNIAQLAGILVGLIAPLKMQVFNNRAPLFFAGDAFDILGAAVIPGMMLALGATLYEGPGAGRVPLRIIIGTVVTRLVLSPVIGAAGVYFVYMIGAFQVPDRMFLLVMYMIHMVPSAMNLQVMASITQSCELEVAALIFWQWIFSLISIPVALFFFIRMVEHIPIITDEIQ